MGLPPLDPDKISMRRYASARVLYEMLEGIELPYDFERHLGYYLQGGSSTFLRMLLELDPSGDMRRIAITAQDPTFYRILPTSWQNALLWHAQQWIVLRTSVTPDDSYNFTFESVKEWIHSGTNSRNRDRNLLVIDLDKIYPKALEDR